MKIYDCITFFDESLQVDLRFNILNKYVEKFIVCESKFDHKGRMEQLMEQILLKSVPKTPQFHLI